MFSNLKNLRQSVQINNSVSTVKNVLAGVPQDSIE